MEHFFNNEICFEGMKFIVTITAHLDPKRLENDIVKYITWESIKYPRNNDVMCVLGDKIHSIKEDGVYEYKCLYCLPEVMRPKEDISLMEGCNNPDYDILLRKSGELIFKCKNLSSFLNIDDKVYWANKDKKYVCNRECSCSLNGCIRLKSY